MKSPKDEPEDEGDDTDTEDTDEGYDDLEVTEDGEYKRNWCI